MYIGKYKVLGRLGQGGTSTVYKALHENLGKIVALKVLKPHPFLETLLTTADIRDRFINEARAMASLTHRNIAAVWDLEMNGPDMMMVLEYICMDLGTLIGESYRAEKASRTVAPLQAISYLRQTLQGLACLHMAGIVHRDIKPFNLMLTVDGEIKIIDLGISKMRGETKPVPSGLKVGTPYYTAPEQEAAPQNADVRADLYSAGVLLYRLVTGCLPEDRPNLSGHPLLDENWQAFFDIALALAPEDRFDDTQAMLKSIDALECQWNAKQEMVCAYPVTTQTVVNSGTYHCRSKPLRTGVLEKNPFNMLDDLRRPRNFIQNRIESVTTGFWDHSTDLLWAMEVSFLAMPWTDCADYCRAFPQQDTRFGQWRLPTVEELVSLLQPLEQRQDFCTPKRYGDMKPWLWTADRRSYVSAWIVDVANGAVLWLDFTCQLNLLMVADMVYCKAIP